MTRRLVFFGSFIFLAALAVAVTLPGCNTSAVPAGTTATAVPFSAGTVYIADSTKQQILLLPPSPGPNSQPANPIAGSSTGLTGPQYMRFDGAHQLYVANFNGTSSVLILPVGAQNNIAPVATITSPVLGQVFAAAPDSNQNIYATAVFNGTSELLIFPKGSSGSVTNPVVITNGLSSPRGLGFDSRGNLWVANSGNGTVVEFSPAQLVAGGTPIATVTSTGPALQTPTDVIFDGQGQMYVSDSTANAVFVFGPFASGATTPLGTLVGAATTMSAPSGIALGADGTIYVANFGAKNLLLFAPRSFVATPPATTANVAPEATIVNGLSSVTDVELTF